MKVLEIQVDVKTVSENNRCDHWVAKNSRKREQRAAVWSAWLQAEPIAGYGNIFYTPITVTITRYSPHTLDGDNLQGSVKAIRDTVANLMYPGHRPGIADSAHGLTWEYKQEKGPLGRIDIKIERP